MFSKKFEAIPFCLIFALQFQDPVWVSNWCLEDSVAQLVEHDTFNVGVLGSSPSGITKNEIRSVHPNGFRF